MTPAKFNRYAQKTRLHARGRDAARLVLVDGMRQADVARQLGASRAAVSAWVKAVLRARVGAAPVPKTWQTVTVTVPKDVADMIRKMARRARDRLRHVSEDGEDRQAGPPPAE